MDKINVDELFRCFNCQYMVDEPHESECCGKLYCQNCIVDLTYTQCKLCKKVIKLRANRFAKNLLQMVELKCKHHCGGKFKYEEMKSHMYRCEFRIFKCTIEFCCFVGRKSELITHMVENHDIYLIALLENYDDFNEAFEKIMKNPIEKQKKRPSFNCDVELSNPGVLPRLRTIVNQDNLNDGNSEHLNVSDSDHEDDVMYTIQSENYYGLLNHADYQRRNRLRPISEGYIGEEFPFNYLENENNTYAHGNINNINNAVSTQENLINQINNLSNACHNSPFSRERLRNSLNGLNTFDNNLNINMNLDTHNLQVNNLHNQLNSQLINLHRLDGIADLSNNLIALRNHQEYVSSEMNYSDNSSNLHEYEINLNATNEEEGSDDVYFNENEY